MVHRLSGGVVPVRELTEMDPGQRLLLNTMTAAMIGFAACARAQPAPSVVAPTVATSLGAAAAEESAQHAVAQAQINDAVRDLERATLQWDFTSNASELALLQHAHDQLSAAASQLQEPSAGQHG